ncbi:hypothetical protein [Fervidibacter sacchari]
MTPQFTFVPRFRFAVPETLPSFKQLDVRKLPDSSSAAVTFFFVQPRQGIVAPLIGDEKSVLTVSLEWTKVY